MSDKHGNPSTPWEWMGGYPQRITSADAILVAEVWENPDMPARIAPLICEAVNTYLRPRRRWWRRLVPREQRPAPLPGTDPEA